MEIGAAEIRKWHTDPKPKGNGWSDIGYHYVIRRDGTVEEGRDMDAVGAHVKGYNEVSLGICLVGGWKGQFDFTRRQMDALEALVSALLLKYNKAVVRGHRSYNSKKSCPGFDVETWWYNGGYVA
jgi:N-acetylmuramoyl-L-alanine amidase